MVFQQQQCSSYEQAMLSWSMMQLSSLFQIYFLKARVFICCRYFNAQLFFFCPPLVHLSHFRHTERAVNISRKTRYLKDSCKAWRTIDQYHFKRLREGLTDWKQNGGRYLLWFKGFCTKVFFSIFSMHLIQGLPLINLSIMLFISFLSLDTGDPRIWQSSVFLQIIINLFSVQPGFKKETTHKIYNIMDVQ